MPASADGFAGGAWRASEQLVTEKPLQHHPRGAVGKSVVAAADDMNTAALAQALQHGSGLHLQQLDAWLAPREHDRDLNAAPRNLLELPRDIAAQVDVQRAQQRAQI